MAATPLVLWEPTMARLAMRTLRFGPSSMRLMFATRASSPGKRARTTSSKRRLISNMISRWRGRRTSNQLTGHFSSASGRSVWLVYARTLCVRDQAWSLTQRVLAYTNHTLLPEALEKWPVNWFEVLLPRHLEIIFEINRRLLEVVRARFPGDDARVANISLIEEGPNRRVRMANLAIVGSHSTNGVAAIHSGLLRTTTVKDLAELFPERFNNKTNGVTPRRWLLLCNPSLAGAITGAIGEGWITELGQLRRLAPLADDRAFRDAVRAAKRESKIRFAAWLRSATGQAVDPDTIFDSQVKRIHEYKRQLLNALRVIVL